MTLRVLARGSVLVPVPGAANVSPRRFIGRYPDAHEGQVVQWLASPEPTEVPTGSRFYADYLLAIRDGSLWPADALTAQVCGVAFDPTFGGEYAEKATS